MMQRAPIHLSSKEEWTKYFVNGIECPREAIYQTVLDNEFYNDTVELCKKYHLNIDNKKTTEDTVSDSFSFVINTKTSSKNKSCNVSTKFSLETKKFVDRLSPASEEYKVLIERMIHALDMSMEAQRNYNEFSKRLATAVRDCVSFAFGHATDVRGDYDDILLELSIEQMVFICDLLAFSQSTSKNRDNIQMPGFEFDSSSINEPWDEHGSNKQKSQFLKKYLVSLLKQTDTLRDLWVKKDYFADLDSRKEILDKISEFKKILKYFQKERASLDADLLGDKIHFLKSKITSFFHYKPNQLNSEISQNSETSCHRITKN